MIDQPPPYIDALDQGTSGITKRLISSSSANNETSEGERSIEKVAPEIIVEDVDEKKSYSTGSGTESSYSDSESEYTTSASESELARSKYTASKASSRSKYTASKASSRSKYSRVSSRTSDAQSDISGLELAKSTEVLNDVRVGTLAKYPSEKPNKGSDFFV